MWGHVHSHSEPAGLGLDTPAAGKPSEKGSVWNHPHFFAVLREVLGCRCVTLQNWLSGLAPTDQQASGKAQLGQSGLERDPVS